MLRTAPSMNPKPKSMDLVILIQLVIEVNHIIKFYSELVHTFPKLYQSLILADNQPVAGYLSCFTSYQMKYIKYRLQGLNIMIYLNLLELQIYLI